MDELYSDLDNYNEANVISELRNQNMDLKIKLQECTVIMENLQKDYDRVSTEFKRLEINYSSLLKTAKAEIERKTQIISNLNLEKDTMVLNSIQNRNSFRYNRNLTLERKNKCSQNSDSDWSKSKDRKEVSDIKRTNTDCKWKEEKPEVRRLPSEDTTTSNNTERAHRLPHSDRKIAHCPAGSKENSNALKGSEPIRTEATASSIRNRRKSMPASNSAKFSSDDESEGVPNRDHAKEDIKKHRDYDKHAFKSSSRRRQHEIDRYHKRDRFETLRHHRPRSSDRSKDHRRLIKDTEDNYHRQDSRRRVSGSPPPSSHYHHRSSRDIRSDKPTAYERSGHRHVEKYSVKHKLEEYDAPSSKRVRTEERSHSHDLRRQKVKSLIPDMEHQLVTTCQSPEMLQDNITSQPIKEIKLQASEETILDDPRKLSSRYISDDIKQVLSAATGMNVDIVPLKKTDWGIDVVPIPDALNPSTYDAQSINDVYTGIDDPISNNMSVESGEISDSEASNTLSHISSTTMDSRKTVENLCSQNNKPDHMDSDYVSKFHKGLQDQLDEDCKEPGNKTEEQKNPGTITKYRIPKIKPERGNCETISLDTMSTNVKSTKLDHRKPKTNFERNKTDSQDISHINKAIIVSDLKLSDDDSDSAEKPMTLKDADTKTDKNLEQFCSQNLSNASKRDDSRQKTHKTKNPSPSNIKKSSSVVTFERNAGDKVILHDSKNKKGLETEYKTVHRFSECDTKHTEEKITSKKAEPHVPNASGKSADEARAHQDLKYCNSKLIESRTGDKKNTRCSKTRKGEIKQTTAEREPKERQSQAFSTLVEIEAINHTNTCYDLKERNTKCIDGDAGERHTEVTKKSSNKINKCKSFKETEKHTLKKSQMTDEKKDLKKDKIQIQAKYSDLFGDASLISPEDLGIDSEKSQKPNLSNYTPICEDAIDSTDLHADKFDEADPTKPTQAADNTVDAPDANHEMKDNSEEVYTNIIAADIKESDVVKTVIISTGVQPDVSDGSVEPALSTEREIVNKIHQEIFTNVQEASSLKALATSTPHKNAYHDNDCETSSKIAAISSNVNKDTSNNNVSETKPSQPNEKDAPDVRIVLNRKRKVIKTATPSKA